MSEHRISFSQAETKLWGNAGKASMSHDTIKASETFSDNNEDNNHHYKNGNAMHTQASFYRLQTIWVQPPPLHSVKLMSRDAETNSTKHQWHKANEPFEYVNECDSQKPVQIKKIIITIKQSAKHRVSL